MPARIQLNVHLPADLLEQIRAAAAGEYLSMSQWVRAAIREKLTRDTGYVAPPRGRL